MKKITSIQEAIEKRAREKAVERVNELISLLRDGGFHDRKAFSQTNVTYDIDGKEKTTSLRNFFWGVESIGGKMLVDQIYQEILPGEVERFVKDIDRLKEEVDGLHYHLEHGEQGY